jgi:hypothetical protein
MALSQEMFSQHKHMQASICQLLMENVLKLGTLTDAKLFLVMENSEGQRRIMGEPSLIQSYLGGSLHPREDDLRLDLDPNAVTTGILERPANICDDDLEMANLDSPCSGSKRNSIYVENEFCHKKSRNEVEDMHCGTRCVHSIAALFSIHWAMRRGQLYRVTITVSHKLVFL